MRLILCLKSCFESFVPFQAGDILRPDYEPSEDDILYAEGVTFSNGLASIDFAFPPERNYDYDVGDQHDSLLRYV